MKDIGIDLGTANVLIYVKNEGIVLNAPSVIAIDSNTKNVLAVGKEADEMLGRTPGKVKAIKPLKDGVIADFEYTEAMLEQFINKVRGKNPFSRLRILICCPSNITAIEKNAIKEVGEKVGAKKVFIEEEAKAAAVGAGMDIGKPSGNMIIDIGGGTTDIAILSLGSIVNSCSLKFAGNAFDLAIIEFVKDKYKVQIGEKTAEEIKLVVGCVFGADKNNKYEVKGRDTSKGLPTVIEVSELDVEEALEPLIKKIVSGAKKVLEETLPELSADIASKGIVLTGGGCLLKGFDKYLEKELGVSVYIADNPLTCVVEGCGILLQNIHLLES